MSTVPAPIATATAVATPVPAAPAAPKSAIQLIEEQIVGFIKQREQAIANVHAVEGALQGAQHLLTLLKNEAVKAESEATKVVTEIKTKVNNVVSAVEAEAKKL